MTAFTKKDETNQVQYIDFLTHTLIFKDACEKSFGTESKMTINVMSANKEATATPDTHLKGLIDKINAAKTTLTTEDLAAVKKQIFNQAAYIEVNIEPANNKTPELEDNFAKAVFKGDESKESSYKIHPEDDNTTALLQRLGLDL